MCVGVVEGVGGYEFGGVYVEGVVEYEIGGDWGFLHGVSLKESAWGGEGVCSMVQASWVIFVSVLKMLVQST